ncbi:MAG TPA: SDR family NAD(P)-dependent oxidoreductase [Trueperaceae bacterium]|nr:SDR family NAD(P)-dependent oxidoreductase [Trueperaceae bacterium]
MKANGKVIVVTGAGSGMGRQLALQLLNKGAKVAAVDLNGATLEETASLAGNRAELALFTLDIADKAAVEALPEQVVGRFKAVDGIINNAGIIQPMVRVADLEFATMQNVLNVNLYGVLYMTKAFLPYLLERPEAHIVNVSSMGGFLPVPGQTVYGASKAAVKLFTEGLWSELAETSVRVTVVFPGAINTNIAANSGLGAFQEQMTAQGDGSAAARKTPRMTPADEAARLIIQAMEDDRYRVLVGRDAKFMDMLYRLSPQRAARFIYRQMRSILPG